MILRLNHTTTEARLWAMDDPLNGKCLKRTIPLTYPCRLTDLFLTKQRPGGSNNQVGRYWCIVVDETLRRHAA
jgi:hypothetical protein